MKRIYIFIIFVYVSIGQVFSQDCPIILSNLPKYGSNFTSLNSIFEKSEQCKIVLFEGIDSIVNQRIINRFAYWFLNSKASKSIINYTDIDYVSINADSNESCLFIGTFNELPDISKYGLPLTQKGAKLIIGGTVLEGNNDAVVIVNASGKYIAAFGGSIAALDNIAFRWLGFYDYYILKNNKIKYFGNLKDGIICRDSLINVDLIRMKNYSNVISNNFIEAHFSCQYKNVINVGEKIDSLNSVFTTFCDIYKVTMPSQKLKYFIHNDSYEINIVSGSPKPGSTAGFVIDSTIHTVGLDIGLLSHEGVHFIFNSSVSCPNSFFNESIPMSFGYFLNSNQIKSDCNLIKDYLSYDFEPLISAKSILERPQ
ncbi:MAG: hypothetical protein HC905_09585 [Bacteroidales bacterium]|nr:hypothetical protein [Bacteroidales bacterium]